MKPFSGKQIILKIVFITLFLISYSEAQDNIPIIKEESLKIQSISPVVGQGEALFLKAEKPKTIKAEVTGTIPVIDGKNCLFCVKTIKIGPNLRIPLRPFFTASPAKGESMTLNNFSLTGPEATEDTTEYILSGENGATLQKESNGFILIEGKAYIKTNLP